jgi:FlaA1/EpsC-like NDP-sugar epimerase
MTHLNEYLLRIPRLIKRSLVLSLDVGVCIISVWLAFYLRLGEWVSLSGVQFLALLLALCLSIPIFIISGLYRMIFRYTGWSAFSIIIKATVIYGILYSTVITVVSIDGIPRTIGIIQPLLLLLGVAASRVLAHYWLSGTYKKMIGIKSNPIVLIYGAGSTGRQLARAIDLGGQMKVAGFIDDDTSLQKSNLDGKMIYSPMDLEYLVNSLKVTDVLLAIPSVSRSKRNEILQKITHCRVSVRNLPSLTDLAGGKVTVSDLRELDIEDLLGRTPVPPDPLLISKNIDGQSVLVTGAGGSIGSELCRQILQNCPRSLLLVDHSEHALYQVHQNLLHLQEILGITNEQLRLIPLIGSVQDRNRMVKIFDKYHPNTIFHAAAYKHVPLVESNSFEAIKNNIIGTKVLAQVASQYGVKNFVLISTDKAVRPTNIMGATKRVAELVIQSMAASHFGQTTCFTMVRFGNVLDSSGSVVPKFREQIRGGGPITLTDLEVTRYFMTIPEAAQLVIQAGAMAKGGEVFVLDMGEPVKIADLAVRMIQLSGLTVKTPETPEGDIEIQIIGLRPGEKLHEELLIGDNPISTNHKKIMKARENFLEIKALEKLLTQIEILGEIEDVEKLSEFLVALNIGYYPKELYSK